ncbi:MAG: formyltransferase family protein [Clostridium sp.]|nr:formyltransferase family protein [Clostridium sp.]
MVITFEEINVQKKYNEEIEQLCSEKNIDCKSWSLVKNNLHNIILNNNITHSIAIGWKYLIPLSINRLLEDDLIIFHDSLLPKYRGFAPTSTAIICGDEEIGMSVIYASEEVDSGDIILQKKFNIKDNMYIDEIIDKQSNLYSEAIEDLINMIKRNRIHSVSQDETKATYSIWRNPEDCRIDWSMSSKQIFNLIRAVGFPYTGAYTYYENEKIFIWKSEIVEEINFAIRHQGKIWSCKNDMPIIVCGTGMLRLINITDEHGNKIKFPK